MLYGKEPDLAGMLKDAKTEIKMAEYRISRCVDAGDYHVVL